MEKKISFERLDKILSSSGYGSRRDVKNLVRGKNVKVNGKLVLSPDEKVSVENDKIEVDGKILEIAVNAYFMLNKPAGYVCSTKSDSHNLVMELLKDEENRKYLGGNLNMVGRLDLDTEGLLIITSDGLLNHKLTFPKYRAEKTYLVYLRDKVDCEKRKFYKEEIVRGIHIDAEGKAAEADCAPANLEWKDEDEFPEIPAVCLISVYEGMFHEIKRIFKALGNEVIYLKRLKINNLNLDPNLKPGEYRTLSGEELELLCSSTC